jgi:hypothetical protein
MHDQLFAARKARYDVFGAPMQRRHRLPFEAFGEAVGERKSQIGAAGFQPVNPASKQGWLQAAAYGFDFGKFWHRP